LIVSPIYPILWSGLESILLSKIDGRKRPNLLKTELWRVLLDSPVADESQSVVGGPIRAVMTVHPEEGRMLRVHGGDEFKPLRAI
jgi:hypothetical protein